MFDNLAQKLFGAKRAESDSVLSDAGTNTIHGTAVTDSSNGSVMVELSSDVTNPDPIEVDGEVFFEDADTSVELPTTENVKEGDEVLVSVLGNTPMRSPVVTGVVGSGDRIAADAEAAREIAEATGQHFWHDDNGAHVTELPREEWEAQQTGPNSLWNSLGMLFRNGLKNLLAVLTSGIAIYDGEGNDADNILAEFSASNINIGRSFADDGLTQASVGFFDGDTLLDAQHYVTGGSTYQDLYLSTKLEGEAAGQDVRSSLGTHLETAAEAGHTYDRAETGMTAAAAPQGMSAAELSVSAGYDGTTLTRLLSAKADSVFLTSLQSQAKPGTSIRISMDEVIDALKKAIRLGTTYTGSKNVAITANTDIMGASVTVPAGTYLVICWQTFRNPGSSGQRTTTIGTYSGGSLASYTTAVQATRDQVRVQHLNIITTTGSSTTLQAYARSNIAVSGNNNSQIDAVCIG